MSPCSQESLEAGLREFLDVLHRVNEKRSRPIQLREPEQIRKIRRRKQVLFSAREVNFILTAHNDFRKTDHLQCILLRFAWLAGRDTEVIMSIRSKVCPPGIVSRESGKVLPRLSCFARWEKHEASSGDAAELRTMKVEVLCRECATLFVKYVYDGTVRCEACRKARREAAQEVRKISGEK